MVPQAISREDQPPIALRQVDYLNVRRVLDVRPLKLLQRVFVGSLGHVAMNRDLRELEPGLAEAPRRGEYAADFRGYGRPDAPGLLRVSEQLFVPRVLLLQRVLLLGILTVMCPAHVHILQGRSCVFLFGCRVDFSEKHGLRVA